MMAFSGVTSQCEERGFRRSAGTNFEIAIAVVPAGTKCFSLLRKTRGRSGATTKMNRDPRNSVLDVWALIGASRGGNIVPCG